MSPLSEVPPRDPLFTAPFFRLWFFGFITFFSAFQLFPTIPFRIIELGGSKAQGGLFLAIYTGACAFSAPLTGTIADHIGRKRLLIIGSTAFFVFSLLYGVTTNLALLLPFACLHGIFWSSILASAAAISTEIIPASRRTEGMAYWGMSGTAAVAVAPLVGLSVYRYGWVTLCLEIAALAVVMIILGFRIHGGDKKHNEPFPHLTQIIDWRVIATAMSLFMISFSYGGITSYVAMLAIERKIDPPSLFFTVFAITILITRLLVAPFGDRFGPKVLLYPSLAMVPLGLLLLAVSDSRSELVLAAILYGAGFGGAYPAFISFVLGRTNPLRRGATFGSVLWAFDTGIGSGSLLTGLLVQGAGFTTAFRVGAIVSALSIPLFMMTSRLLGSGEREG